MNEKRRHWTKELCTLLFVLAVFAGCFIANAEDAEASSKPLSEPKINGSVVRGDAAYFGSFAQSDSTGTKKDPIKWRVLSINGNDAFLVSDTKLNVGKYHDKDAMVTFANSSLRTWMNSEFLNSAFNTAEQKALISTGGDKVSLLTHDEVMKDEYGFISSHTRAAKNTPYTCKLQQKKGVSAANVNMTNGIYWGAYWLKMTSNSQGYIIAVRGNGSIDATYKVSNENFCLRPVIHLDLSYSEWQYAGKIMSNGQTAPKVPANLSAAKINYYQGKLTWATVPEADGYVVDKYENGKYKQSYAISNAATTSWLDKSLTPGCSYSYKIRAYWSVGNSKEYSQYSSATAAFTAEKAPQVISGNNTISKEYGSKPFTLGASAKTAISYKSSNTDIATVSGDGIVTLKRAGTVKITVKAAEGAQYRSASKTITITVSKGKQSISAKTSLSKNFGSKPFSLGASAKTELTYKTSNKKVVTVSSDGKVTLKNPGKAKITVKAAETGKYKAASKTVTINVKLKAPTLSAKITGKKKVKLSWSKVPGATKYEVHMYDAKKKKFVKKITKPAIQRTAWHKGMKKGTYKYKVRAYRKVDGKKVYSPYSSVKKVKIK